MFRDYHRLGKKQLAVINDMFENGLTEAQALEKHNVSLWLYRKWLGSTAFMEEYRIRLRQAEMMAKLMLFRYLPTAAARLIELTTCDKEETARKACLDIISIHTDAVAQKASGPDHGNSLSPRMQARLEEPGVRSKIFAVMAGKL